MRHQLIDAGKFSTTGILFDVNSDTIKPTSYGVVKEIADVLEKFPDARIRIIGHTDTDGNDVSNLELSKKRSAAVKNMLTTEFHVDASRIETDGKGELQPVADNKTREGKAILTKLIRGGALERFLRLLVGRGAFLSQGIFAEFGPLLITLNFALLRLRLRGAQCYASRIDR